MQYNILIKKHILIEHKHIQLQLKVIKLFGYVLRNTRDNKYQKKKHNRFCGNIILQLYVVW